MVTAAWAALQVFLRWWLGLAFLTAGTVKVAGRETRAAVASLRQPAAAVRTPVAATRLPAPAGRWPVAAARLPALAAVAGFALLGTVEAAVGALLLAGFHALPVTVAALALLGLFTLHLARLVLRQERRRCRCGGLLGDHLVTRALLLRNGVLLAGAALLLAAEIVLDADVSLDCALGACLPQNPLSPAASLETGAVLGGSAVGLLLAASTTYAYWRLRPTADTDTLEQPTR